MSPCSSGLKAAARSSAMLRMKFSSEMVMLFELARRTARKSRKHRYFTSRPSAGARSWLPGGSLQAHHLGQSLRSWQAALRNSLALSLYARLTQISISSALSTASDIASTVEPFLHPAETSQTASVSREQGARRPRTYCSGRTRANIPASPAPPQSASQSLARPIGSSS